MATARKKAAETMAMIDVVIEVLDARIPGASTNPMIAELRRHRQRPSLKILNKADAADPAVTATWLREFGGEVDVKAIAVSCKRPADVAKIPAQAASLAPHRNRSDKPVRLMIMGKKKRKEKKKKRKKKEKKRKKEKKKKKKKTKKKKREKRRKIKDKKEKHEKRKR